MRSSASEPSLSAYATAEKPRSRGRGFLLALTAFAAFALLACVDLYAVFHGYFAWRVFTKPPLVLLLALATASAQPLDRPRKWFLAALAWSAVGDTILLGTGDRAFVFGTFAFALAHVSFISAFATAAPGSGLVRKSPWVALPYVAGWIASTILLVPHMGALAYVAVPYGLLLMVMALFALDLGGRVPLRNALLAAAGALLFMISDGNIATARFDPALAPPNVEFFIMLLYLLSQTAMTLAFALPGISSANNSPTIASAAVLASRDRASAAR